MEILTELLPCPLCKLPNFENVHSLRSTLITAATKQLNCPVCNECVLGLDKLTIHLFAHINDNLIKNDINVIANIDTSKNSEQEVTQPFKNNLAEISTMTEINSLPNNLETDPLICDICNFTFSNQSILELHQKLLHQTNPNKETGVYNFHCHLCTKKFKMKGSLIVHLRVAHYGFSDPNTGRNKIHLLKDGKKETQRSCESKQWECDICNKMFTTKYFLKKHKRLHTGEMPYTCSQCNKSFTFQQSYHKHMLYHSSEKPHTCYECGRSFKELSTLQNHARIHSGERPFICETCGKSFRQRVSYLVHRRIHTGVMPYNCNQCGKKFRYKVSQRSHKCVPTSASESGGCNFVQKQTPEDKDDTIIIHETQAMNHKGDSFQCNTSSGNDYQNSLNHIMENNLHNGDELSVNTHDIYSMIFSPLLSEVDTLSQIHQK